MKRLSLSSLGAIFSGVRKLIDRTIGTAVKSAAAEASAGWEQFVSDEIPIHNIVNPIVDYYFKLLPTLGYKYSDVSRMWYFTKYVSESSKKNMADRSNPFLVFCSGGDSLLLESEGLPSQTILPSNGVFACYQLLPGKVYHWTVMKGTTVIKEGDFKTIGFIRLINIPTWPNVRDIAYAPVMKMNRVLRGANPDNVVVGSADHNLIQSLGIDFQINMRKPSASSNTEKPWRPDLFPAGIDCTINDYTSCLTKPTGWKTVLTTLLTELKAGHRVAFNCYAGADRTGTLCYILQGICGVPRRIAQGYYELTSLLYWLNTKMWDDTGGEDDFRQFDKAIEKKYGPDYYTQCYRFLTEVVGITAAQIKELQQELMVDPSSAPTPILPS